MIVELFKNTIFILFYTLQQRLRKIKSLPTIRQKSRVVLILEWIWVVISVSESFWGYHQRNMEFELLWLSDTDSKTISTQKHMVGMAFSELITSTKWSLSKFPLVKPALYWWTMLIFGLLGSKKGHKTEKFWWHNQYLLSTIVMVSLRVFKNYGHNEYLVSLTDVETDFSSVYFAVVLVEYFHCLLIVSGNECTARGDTQFIQFRREKVKLN